MNVNNILLLGGLNVGGSICRYGRKRTTLYGIRHLYSCMRDKLAFSRTLRMIHSSSLCAIRAPIPTKRSCFSRNLFKGCVNNCPRHVKVS